MAGGGTAGDVGLLILRLAGVALATHGWQKATGDMSKFAGGVEKLGFPMPIVFAWAAALSELVGGAMVALGLYARIGAAFAAFTMAVAAFGQHAKDDFATKEKALLYLTIMAAVACLGAGRFSLDRAIRRKP